ncbi:hypothetical protein [Paenisporosarcina sp. TG20]|uniref:hypothetical protein n=1 Tax=Paenisporosarcina sp. TG20 TaxID=1211706 RepID=UPI0002D55CEC|nr:hypothetical protein [Paenisporosarcina sp. TG20]
MKKFIISTMMIALILVLAACGGDDSTSGVNDTSGGESPTSNTVELVASNWEFEKDSYSVPAGEVTINLVNGEGFHGITIEGTDVKIDGDGSATTSLEPGEYKVICSVPCGEGHAEMTTQLIVE